MKPLRPSFPGGDFGQNMDRNNRVQEGAQNLGVATGEVRDRLAPDWMAIPTLRAPKPSTHCGS